MPDTPENQPAFPQDLQGRRGDDPQYQGMSLRAYFAAHALAGIMANKECNPCRQEHFDNIAKDALDAADALLSVLAKDETSEP